jgi:electron transport complex protein RnfC
MYNNPMLNIFAKGVYFKKPKTLLNSPIEVMPTPQKVFIPFLQHKGEPAIPIVKPGDTVRIGMKIGEPANGVSSVIHSSVSGKVLEIKPLPHPFAGKALCCIIESDSSENWERNFIDTDYHSLEKEELLKRIKDAGIVGLGGGGFPTDIKIFEGMKGMVKILIINCCESEPNLCADYRTIIEYPQCVIEGARIIQKILDAPEMIFAVSGVYKDIIKVLKKDDIIVKVFPPIFPQGSERLLMKEILKRRLQPSELPVDYGAIVQNASTCYAVYQAVKYNKPLIERIITVTGDGIQNEKNILAKIGTPVDEIIKFCGGLKKRVKKIIFGGLMTGIAQFSFHVPIIKPINGIVFQSSIDEEILNECTRCGFCIDVCPMDLLPQIMYRFIKENDIEEAFDYGLNECIECGCCAYVCPSNIPLVHYFKSARIKSSNG